MSWILQHLELVCDDGLDRFGSSRTPLSVHATSGSDAIFHDVSRTGGDRDP
jgi:hypothetical protein